MRVLTVVAMIVLLLYPLLVYVGMQWLEPRVLGLAIATVYLLRFACKVKHWWQRLLIVTALTSAAAVLWWSNDETLLKLLPTAINVAMAGFFMYSLVHPPTLPARVAALDYPEGLPDIVLTYTTWVTRIWVGFFLVNAALAAVTALFASREVWALYNGVIAYLLMGLLFGGEFAYRHLIFHKKHAL
ncbi:hypothetical protein QWI17_18275 [Gilvimarinus sp. SDUM040013]|uniref:Intracellular septation protein A n=1 Tax=Gilvimarinus gilvus TaxID=3058038 RepID=A0ABU4S3G6_9GAMM|nr:hypothetical protein [Gilvimarinus sp. SDUM040013]MDO3387796.1 hypothetical protein [Gilvimarinus sp. SDUM040013]MDX6851061.1 hypothetical protein [Gilvimarinus sp. SDUM040013]